MTAAWLVERTDAPFKTVFFVGAFASLAMPALIKGIGWILLLGPNAGAVNTLLAQLLGLAGGPVNIFSLGGMVFVEAVLWTPAAFLMARAPLRAIDPALEDAAAMSGGGMWRTFRRVTMPLAIPGVLAVLALTFIRSFESFDIPLLLGTPGGIRLATTEIYHTVKSGLVPRYGEASAYAVLLTSLVLVTLVRRASMPPSPGGPLSHGTLGWFAPVFWQVGYSCFSRSCWWHRSRSLHGHLSFPFTGRHPRQS